MKIIRPVAVAQTGTLTRASTGTYWDKNGVLQTAIANALRITYNPADLTQPPYALIEPAATNLFNYSQDLTQATWSKVSTTASLAARNNCTGGNVSRLIPNTSNTNHYTAMVSSPSLTPGQSYTATFCVSYTGSPTQAAIEYVDGVRFRYLTVDLTNGSVLNADPLLTVSVPTRDAFGFYTFSVTCLIAASSPYAPRVSLFASQPGTGLTFAGDGVSGLDVAYAQLEAGTKATSYVLSTGSVGNRSADSLAGSGLLYSSLPENDYPAWNATTLYTTGTNVLDLATRSIYQSITGVSGTSTFTAASAGNVTMLKSDGTTYVPAVNTPIQFTGATMPTGITSGTVYYVQAVTATAFSVSTVKGGAAITTGALATATSTVASNNYNTPVSTTSSWLNIGYDNRWSMFDQSITSQSTSTSNIQVAIIPGQRLDSVVGLNCSATRAKVSLVDTGTGAVAYSATVNLTANSGITDMYSYFYEPVVRLPDFVLSNLPVGPSATGVLVVTFEDANIAKVGGVVVGLSKDIGATSSSAKVGIIDYSVKTQDAFGNYTITPRAFSKKADFTVQLPSSTVDFVYNLLATYRSTPIVYIGSNSGGTYDQYNATMVYGFYKDMSIEIAYKTVSMCTLSVEGLT